ncbi:hypothetical protein Pla144_26610 [Bythopirellula polymerisocia]|uniref:Nickel uptake substrate-specific transmembrane region n=1 Tax=Bythopirellula polymerisocia TaxID=2528003 RepID=A0A5C6CW09_9BACT|nr:hypothetical protein Pla144_26610 [Bythopirellula polymerisocia]
MSCGKSHVATYPVRGDVVFKDGSTLERGGRVVFQLVGSDPMITAKGYFESDGKFELTTYSKGDGAPAGEYEVMVVPTVPDDKGEMSEREYLKAMNPIDIRFKNAKSSGLKFTVSPETSPHEFRIEVTRPRKR